MKKHTNSKTSETAPHHSLKNPAPATETATAPAKPDTRQPIDHARRAENRKLDTAAVLRLLLVALPAVYSTAQVVGAWVWVSFPERPTADTRQKLSQLGFHWNSTRQAWQHPCGKFSLGSKSDPRDTYTVTQPGI